MIHPDLLYKDRFASDGVHIIKPRRDGAPASTTNAIGQSGLIARELPNLCETLGCDVVIWDTWTATSKQVFNAYVLSGQHHTSGTKKMKVVDSDGNIVSERASADQRDYLATQDHMRDIRDRCLKPVGRERNYHLIGVTHMESAKREIGRDTNGQAIRKAILHGPSVGGPGAVEQFGTEFQAAWQVFVDKKGKRMLRVGKDVDDNAIPFACRTNAGSGFTQSAIPVPDGYAGCQEMLSKLLNKMRLDPADPETGYLSLLLMGLMGSGKTWLAFCLATLPGCAGVLYVAADGDSEYLRSVPDEALGM